MTSVTTINTFGDYYMNVDDGSNSNRAVARFNKAMDTTMTTPAMATSTAADLSWRFYFSKV